MIAGTIDAAEASIIAIVSGFAGIITAVGGVLLAIRAMRSKERKNAAKEIDQLADQLAAERSNVIDAEVWGQQCAMLLARAGLDVPPRPERRRESDRPRSQGVEDPGDGIPDSGPAAGNVRRFRRARRGRGRERGSTDESDDDGPTGPAGATGTEGGEGT